MTLRQYYFLAQLAEKFFRIPIPEQGTREVRRGRLGTDRSLPGFREASVWVEDKTNTSVAANSIKGILFALTSSEMSIVLAQDRKSQPFLGRSEI